MYSEQEMRIICEELIEDVWKQENENKSEYEITEKICEEAELRFGLEVVVDNVYREKCEKELLKDDEYPNDIYDECSNIVMLMDPDDVGRYENNKPIKALIVVDINNCYDYDDLYVAKLDGDKVLIAEDFYDWE